jgi:N-acetylmuramoyl-L-alanine amidase
MQRADSGAMMLARHWSRVFWLLLIGGTPLFATGAEATAKNRARAESGAAATVSILGRQYIRLSDWAQKSGLQVRWVKQDETLEASNSKFKIRFRVNSSESDVNGISVRLLFPVAMHNGAAYLTQLDAETTFRPILFPPVNRGGQKVKTICLDPGHGGNDPGNRNAGREEKNLALLLAQELSAQLTKAGFKVSLTRTSDKKIELPMRPELAKRRGADLFVSLHFNSFPDKSVQGAEVYALTPAGAPSSNARGEGAGAGAFAGNKSNDKNMFLAYQVQKSLTKNLPVEDRGVHRARFWVLRDAVMPSVLIEAGFLSHPVEGKKIADPAYRRQMARAIAEGVVAYKRQVEQK